MIDVVQRFIQDVCLSVLGLIGGVCLLYWIVAMTRRFFARARAIGLVAHRIVQSGLMCPKTRGWFNAYPPLANDWANPSYEIGDWILLSVEEYPEPGHVFAEPDPDTSGHMGILDFDGAGISAGISNVNRRFDLHEAEGVVIRKVEE